MMFLAVMGVLAKICFEQGAGLFEVLFYRSFFAIPIIAFWVFLSGRTPAALIPKHRKAQIVRIIVSLISITLCYAAIDLLPLAEATTILFTAPIFAALSAAVLLHEKIGFKHLIGIVAGIIGVVIISRPGSGSLSLIGIGVGVAGAMALGMVATMLRILASRDSPTATTFLFCVVSAAVFGLCYLFSEPDFDSRIIVLMAACSVFGTIGQLLNVYSFKFGSVPDLVSVDFTQIIWTILLSYLVWSIIPHQATWIGAAIIVLGSVLVIRAKSPVLSAKQEP